MSEALQLAEIIKGDPNLAFEGLLFYPTEQSWPETQTFFKEAKAGLQVLGLEPKIVSTGGTPNLVNIGSLDGATEHRAGTFIFNDRMMMACGAARLDDCALNVFSTVVSRAGPERGILDAGATKVFASEIVPADIGPDSRWYDGRDRITIVGQTFMRHE